MLGSGLDDRVVRRGGASRSVREASVCGLRSIVPPGRGPGWETIVRCVAFHVGMLFASHQVIALPK